MALEFDRSQGRLDYYGRTLAYVWVKAAPKPWLFNERAVSQGYANEYTYDSPYAWRSEFLRAEQRAEQGRRGLWRTCR